ncbi:MAG: hypothetical protein CFE24_03105 [Flavobacterium sp. BFFFF2]|nr:MAG: hypothetical protein CFE24_03105 [Flavobacterium sp. BFFFF2]
MNKLLLLSFCVLFSLCAKTAYAQPGFSCDNPIQITSLPYTTTDSAANYSDNPAIEGVPGASGCGTTGAYLNGNDVVYTITSIYTGQVKISMAPTAFYSSIYVYESCANIGVNCLAGLADSTLAVRNIMLNVTVGQTYFIVISSLNSVSGTYSLEIDYSGNLPTNITTTNIASNAATLSWTNNSPVNSVEVMLLQAGAPAPSSGDTGVMSNTISRHELSGLLPNTQYKYYLRSYYNVNRVSAWVGPISFTTLAPPPGCGAFFYDNGGASNLYANNTNEVTTICPTVAGERVTVSFTSFNTQANYDGLYVFDGNSVFSPQIPSTNDMGFVPGSKPGAFWGTNIPGPFTSTSIDGCLTFRFISDSATNYAGWSANVSCAYHYCNTPNNVTASNSTTTSVLLSWIDTTPADSWQVLAVPYGSPNPLSSDVGLVANSNPFTITGLTPATRYNFYVKNICSDFYQSDWAYKFSTATLPINDEPLNAIQAAVNYGSVCQLVTVGTLTSATASTDPIISLPCSGLAFNDVWFKFDAISTSHSISSNITNSSSTDLRFAVYTYSNNVFTQLLCNGSNRTVIHNLTIGTTYYLRVYSSQNTPQFCNFTICISIPSTCVGARSICGANNYANSTNVVSLGTIGCLYTTPNGTYFSMKIAQSGPVNLKITQSALGSTIPNLDVDYAAWGPFTNLNEACVALGNGQAPGIGTGATTLTTGCSYSAASTETLNIANAVAGQYYILLITNFSNQVGFINVSQTNVNDVGSGSIDCTGINLNAFIDTNANGTQDTNEVNFGLGQFQYTVNNDPDHHIISPTGIYHIYDEVSSNNYNLSYSINPEYAAYYTASTTYANVNVATGSMTTYNFPVTVLQNYNDIGVNIVPMNAPRAGSTYKNKIIFTNNGSQAIAAGTLTFICQPGTTVTSVSQLGTTAITNGFSYAFTNLQPFETRSIIVKMNVPAIPAVSIGQLLTNTVSVTTPADDAVATNNSSSSTHAVIAAYDPNDKMESHGDKIVYSTYDPTDYLQYTIRFENTGNAGALDVKVSDQLDAKLDASSIKMVGASHAYTLDRVENQLVWNFMNIQLPVSVPDTDTGKGYVTFKVKVKPGYAIGDVIPNAASIYFDSNPAIVTNTFNTEFVSELLGTTQFDENHLLLYPNPASSTVHIHLQDSTESLSTIHVYDLLGKTVLSVSCSSNEQTLDVAPLLKGIYMVEINTESHMKWVKKLIIK